MIQPLKINKKVDNDAKLAQIIKENIPVSEFMSADEVNAMVGKINEMVPAINVSNGGFQGVLEINEKRVDSGFYIPTESGTFINAGNVVVDLSQGINFVTYDGDKWDVAVVPIVADGKVEEGNSGFVSGGEVWDKSVQLIDVDVISNNIFDINTMVIEDTLVSITKNKNLEKSEGWAVAVIPILKKTISIDNWKSNISTIAFFSSPLMRDKDIIYSGRLTEYVDHKGNMYQDKISGKKENILAPVDSKILVLTIKRPGDSDNIYTDLMVNYGVYCKPHTVYEPYFYGIKNIEVVSNKMLIQGEIFNTEDVLTKPLNKIKDIFVVKENEKLAVKIPYDKGNSLVHILELVNDNGIVNPMYVRFIGNNDNDVFNDKLPILHNTVDNIGPFFFKDLITTGANHGVAMPTITVDNGHGKTENDLFSVWKAGTREGYLVKIVSNTELQFLMKESTDNTIYRDFNGNDFTHVTGATNVNNFTSTKRESKEQKPCLKNNYTKIYIDGVELKQDGEYMCSDIEIHNSFQYPDFRKPVFTKPFDVRNSEPMIDCLVKYNYNNDNALKVDYMANIINNWFIDYLGLCQSIKWGNDYDTKFFFPNHQELNRLQLISFFKDNPIEVFKDKVQNNYCINRMVQQYPGVGGILRGYSHGYNPLIGDGSNDKRKEVGLQWAVRNGQKSYQRMKYNFQPNNEIIRSQMFFHYYNLLPDDFISNINTLKYKNYKLVFIDTKQKVNSKLFTFDELKINDENSFEIVENNGCFIEIDFELKQLYFKSTKDYSNIIIKIF